MWRLSMGAARPCQIFVMRTRHKKKKEKKGGVEGMDAVMEYGRCKTEKKTQKKTQKNKKNRDRCGDGVWALQDFKKKQKTKKNKKNTTKKQG